MRELALRREVPVEQLIHPLTQRVDEPALGEGRPLRPFQRVPAHAGGHHRSYEDEDLQWQLRREPKRQGEGHEQRAIGAAQHDPAGEWVPRDRESEHGGDDDAGQGIHLERVGDSRQCEHRNAGRKLLSHADRVAATLGRRPLADTCA